jgi:hypothetical protein
MKKSTQQIVPDNLQPLRFLELIAAMVLALACKSLAADSLSLAFLEVVFGRHNGSVSLLIIHADPQPN